MRWLWIAPLFISACAPNGEMPRVGLPAIEAILLGVLVVGLLRNRLMLAINALFAVLAWPFVVVARACQPAVAALSAATDQAALALRTYGGRLTEPAPLLFELIAPLVYLALFIIIAFADFTVARLRFGALFGEAVSEADGLGLNLADATGLLLVAVFVVLGYILFDALGIAPNRLPWGLLDATWRARLVRGAWAGLILTAIATVAFFCWGQLQLLDDAERPLLLATVLEYLFIVILAVLLVATTLLSGWAVIVSAGALWTLLLFAVRLVVWVVRVAAVLVARGLDLAAALAVFVLDVIAAGPIWLKNWLAGYEVLRRWLHLTPYEREARPPIDAEIDQPLFEPAMPASPPSERALAGQGRQPEPKGGLATDAS